jgi:hypothetical protein
MVRTSSVETTAFAETNPSAESAETRQSVEEGGLVSVDGAAASLDDANGPIRCGAVHRLAPWNASVDHTSATASRVAERSIFVLVTDSRRGRTADSQLCGEAIDGNMRKRDGVVTIYEASPSISA